MPKPFIGVTANRIVESNTITRIAVNEAYLQSVLLAGGLPVTIPYPLPEQQFSAIFDQLDGFLFTGGVEDIDPALYGSSMHPSITEVDKERDALEISLIKRLAAEGKPFLGICRGIEIINVALGGSLYTEISEQHPHSIPHSYPYDPPLNNLVHSVQVEPSSTLGKILGKSEVWVNSFHHQGIRDVAPGLNATARSEDGLVEGVELPGHPFALAVQWHPEELTDQEPMLNLFRALVRSASR
ncbi:MAG: gamma-glutamyl-gamma-aminobutyrate hydrolase family protein [Anaerolineaceae bacterium]